MTGTVCQPGAAEGQHWSHLTLSGGIATQHGLPGARNESESPVSVELEVSSSSMATAWWSKSVRYSSSADVSVSFILLFSQLCACVHAPAPKKELPGVCQQASAR